MLSIPRIILQGKTYLGNPKIISFCAESVALDFSPIDIYRYLKSDLRLLNIERTEEYFEVVTIYMIAPTAVNILTPPRNKNQREAIVDYLLAFSFFLSFFSHTDCCD